MAEFTGKNTSRAHGGGGVKEALRMAISKKMCLLEAAQDFNISKR